MAYTSCDFSDDAANVIHRFRHEKAIDAAAALAEIIEAYDRHDEHACCDIDAAQRGV